jgi:hypothetical protein
MPDGPFSLELAVRLRHAARPSPAWTTVVWTTALVVAWFVVVVEPSGDLLDDLVAFASLLFSLVLCADAWSRVQTPRRRVIPAGQFNSTFTGGGGGGGYSLGWWGDGEARRSDLDRRLERLERQRLEAVFGDRRWRR